MPGTRCMGSVALKAKEFGLRSNAISPSEMASYINGAEIRVDGGLSVRNSLE